MTGVLLQVRLDSTRLPGKALLKIKDLTMIEHAMKSLLKVKVDKHIVVTTSDSIEQLKPLLEKWKWNYFVGSKNNVLERFIGAIREYGLTKIIRATGDNPLVSHELANILLDKHNNSKNDYSGFLNNPLGTGIEVVEVDALAKAFQKSVNDYDKEHVTPYIYNNKDLFKVYQEDAPDKYILKNSTVTVDTSADFARIEKLYNELYHGETISIESVIKWLKQEQ